MKRWQQVEKNRAVIGEVEALISPSCFRLPSYARVVAVLNRNAITTSRGNAWTPKRLVRMLQRNGISGLHGLRAAMELRESTVL